MRYFSEYKHVNCKGSVNKIIQEDKCLRIILRYLSHFDFHENTSHG